MTRLAYVIKAKARPTDLHTKMDRGQWRMTSTAQERTGLYSRLAPVRPAGLPTIHIPANAVPSCIFRHDETPKTKSQTGRMPPVPGVGRGKLPVKRRGTIPYSHRPRFQDSGDSSDSRKNHPLSVCLSTTHAAREAKSKQMQMRKQWNITDAEGLPRSPQEVKDMKNRKQPTAAENQNQFLTKNKRLVGRRPKFLPPSSNNQTPPQKGNISKSKSQIITASDRDIKSTTANGNIPEKTLKKEGQRTSEPSSRRVSKSSSYLAPQQDSNGKLLARRSTLSANKTKGRLACKSVQSNPTQPPVFRFTTASLKSLDGFACGIPVSMTCSASTQKTSAGTVDSTGESKDDSASKTCHVDKAARSGPAWDNRTSRSSLQEPTKVHGDVKANTLVGLHNPRYDSPYTYKPEYYNVSRNRNKLRSRKQQETGRSPVIRQNLVIKLSNDSQVRSNGKNKEPCQNQSEGETFTENQIQKLLTKMKVLDSDERKRGPNSAAVVKFKERPKETLGGTDGPEASSTTSVDKGLEELSTSVQNPATDHKSSVDSNDATGRPDLPGLKQESSTMNDDIDGSQCGSPVSNNNDSREICAETLEQISPENDGEIDLSKLVSSILDNDTSHSVTSSDKASLDSPPKAAPKPPADSFWDADYGFDLLADGGAQKMPAGFLEGQSPGRATAIHDISPCHYSEHDSEMKSPRKGHFLTETQTTSDTSGGLGHTTPCETACDLSKDGEMPEDVHTVQGKECCLGDPKDNELEENSTEVFENPDRSASNVSVADSGDYHQYVCTDELEMRSPREYESSDDVSNDRSILDDCHVHSQSASPDTTCNDLEINDRSKSDDSFWDDGFLDLLQDKASVRTTGIQRNQEPSECNTSMADDKQLLDTLTEGGTSSTFSVDLENQEKSVTRNSSTDDNDSEHHHASETETEFHESSTDKLKDSMQSASEHSVLNSQDESVGSQPNPHGSDSGEYDYSDSFSDLDESVHEEELKTLVSDTLESHDRCQSSSSDSKTEEEAGSPNTQDLNELDLKDGDMDRRAALQDCLENNALDVGSSKHGRHVQTVHINLEKLLHGNDDVHLNVTSDEHSEDSNTISNLSGSERNAPAEFECLEKPEDGNNLDDSALSGDDLSNSAEENAFFRPAKSVAECSARSKHVEKSAKISEGNCSTLTPGRDSIHDNVSNEAGANLYAAHGDKMSTPNSEDSQCISALDRDTPSDCRDTSSIAKSRSARAESPSRHTDGEKSALNGKDDSSSTLKDWEGSDLFARPSEVEAESFAYQSDMDTSVFDDHDVKYGNVDKSMLNSRSTHKIVDLGTNTFSDCSHRTRKFTLSETQATTSEKSDDTDKSVLDDDWDCSNTLDDYLANYNENAQLCESEVEPIGKDEDLKKSVLNCDVRNDSTAQDGDTLSYAKDSHCVLDSENLGAECWTKYEDEAKPALSSYVTAVDRSTLSARKDAKNNSTSYEDGHMCPTKTKLVANHVSDEANNPGRVPLDDDNDDNDDNDADDATLNEDNSGFMDLTLSTEKDPVKSSNEGLSRMSSMEQKHIDIHVPQSGSFHSSASSDYNSSGSEKNEEYSDSFTDVDDSEDDAGNITNEDTESDKSHSEASGADDGSSLDERDEQETALDLSEKDSDRDVLHSQSCSPKSSHGGGEGKSCIRSDDRDGSSTDSSSDNTQRQSRPRKRRARKTCRESTTADRTDRRTPDPDEDEPRGLPPSCGSGRMPQASTEGQSKSEPKETEQGTGQPHGEQRREMSYKLQNNSSGNSYSSTAVYFKAEQSSGVENKIQMPGSLQKKKHAALQETKRTSHEDRTFVLTAQRKRSPRIQTAFSDVTAKEKSGSLAPCKPSPLRKWEQRGSLFSEQTTTAYFRTGCSEPQEQQELSCASSQLTKTPKRVYEMLEDYEDQQERIQAAASPSRSNLPPLLLPAKKVNNCINKDYKKVVTANLSAKMPRWSLEQICLNPDVRGRQADSKSYKASAANAKTADLVDLKTHDSASSKNRMLRRGSSRFLYDLSTTWIQNLVSGSHTMKQMLENGLLPRRPNLDQSLQAMRSSAVQRSSILGSLVAGPQSQPFLVAASPALKRQKEPTLTASLK